MLQELEVDGRVVRVVPSIKSSTSLKVHLQFID
jgi:hypothetical protein